MNNFPPADRRSKPRDYNDKEYNIWIDGNGSVLVRCYRPGETRTVEILLDNETAYTAFQCDLYLPDGLTVDQDDGDYIFDLTPRKARDHSIASQPQSSGAIRVISYSPHINAYSGNSGALVTCSVTAGSRSGISSPHPHSNTTHPTVNAAAIIFLSRIQFKIKLYSVIVIDHTICLAQRILYGLYYG